MPFKENKTDKTAYRYRRRKMQLKRGHLRRKGKIGGLLTVQFISEMTGVDRQRAGKFLSARMKLMHVKPVKLDPKDLLSLIVELSSLSSDDRKLDSLLDDMMPISRKRSCDVKHRL